MVSGPGAQTEVIMLNHPRTKKFALFAVGLSMCYVRPLCGLARYAAQSEFFSYILLIPFICLYLIWLRKPEAPRQDGVFWQGALAPALAGLALLIGYEWAVRDGWRPPTEDYLSLMTGSYLLFLAAGCLAILGGAFSRVIAFPLAFLVFMVPIPYALLGQIDWFFQQVSAIAASGDVLRRRGCRCSGMWSRSICRDTPSRWLRNAAGFIRRWYC